MLLVSSSLSDDSPFLLRRRKGRGPASEESEAFGGNSVEGLGGAVVEKPEER